ncbi:MAG: hypothetical protein AAFU61_03260, partial [Pseudomonadota bacterium]
MSGENERSASGETSRMGVFAAATAAAAAAGVVAAAMADPASAAAAAAAAAIGAVVVGLLTSKPAPNNGPTAEAERLEPWIQADPDPAGLVLPGAPARLIANAALRALLAKPGAPTDADLARLATSRAASVGLGSEHRPLRVARLSSGGAVTFRIGDAAPDPARHDRSVAALDALLSGGSAPADLDPAATGRFGDIRDRLATTEALMKRLAADAAALEAGRPAGRLEAPGGADADQRRAIEAWNAVASRLSARKERTAEGAAELDSSASRISESLSSLAARSGAQAASLEESAAAMEQMSQSVRSTAENAAEADRLARETAGKASNGRGVMAEAVGAMSRIEESSGRISDIVTVIDSI